MNRQTNIIDDDEVARAMAAALQAKGKRKNKVTGGSASTSARSNKTSNVPASRKATRGSSTSTLVRQNQISNVSGASRAPVGSASSLAKKNNTTTVPAASKATGGNASTPVKTNKTSNTPAARKVAGSSTSTPVRPNKISNVPAASKVTGGDASTPIRPNKTTTVPVAKKETRTPITATTNKNPRSRFYEADGLKIPLNDQDGLGDKKKQHARLAQSLRQNDLEELLDIVEQYAGTQKRIEFCMLELSKVEVANWIEEKETLALGRHPKSTLPSKS